MDQPDHDAVAGLNARFATLRTAEGLALGMEAEGGVLDLTETGRRLGLRAPWDVDDLLQNGRGADVRAVLTALKDRPGEAALVDRSAVRFAPVVTRPRKILCVGFNYREHAAETGTPIPRAPPLFAKFANALAPHDGIVTLPSGVDDRFDYETELVIVFGRRCRAVSEADALDVVAGYTIGNDLSARGLQSQTTQFTAGKIPDGFAPVGPWLVTRDRVPEPNALRLETWFNGEQRQDWTTADMIYNCRKLIAFVTSFVTMEPGDLLFTGTPQGVILGQTAPAELRRWIRAGDEVVSRIEGLGELRVTFA